MHYLTRSALHTLTQLQQFLQQIDIQQYTCPLGVLSASSVGMHVRHVVEFYQCLLKGLNEKVIDYDARQRDLLLENNIDFTLSVVDGIVRELSALHEDKVLVLSAGQNLQDDKLMISSSFFRELSYVIEHSIHHFAIIKIACNISFTCISFDRDFGVAYSTIKYRDSVHSNLSA